MLRLHRDFGAAYSLRLSCARLDGAVCGLGAWVITGRLRLACFGAEEGRNVGPLDVLGSVCRLIAQTAHAGSDWVPYQILTIVRGTDAVHQSA